VQDLEARRLRHPEIQERHVERLAVDEPERLAAVRRREDLMAVLLEELAKLGSERGVVVRHEDLHGASLRGIEPIPAAGIKACRTESRGCDDRRSDVPDRPDVGIAFTPAP